ncbi:hypothetical protein JTE90_025717 [Oedothorax gibbosus]|uniref:Uncharacterized protein n=1 Tax=Oedothorax gibbosus TaxID=931172 RepID=A0AAV6UJ75_9ARAC|nr:hypothetical protein JTE90_025717 [Oedothorax gibbosus]
MSYINACLACPFTCIPGKGTHDNNNLQNLKRSPLISVLFQLGIATSTELARLDLLVVVVKVLNSIESKLFLFFLNNVHSFRVALDS